MLSDPKAIAHIFAQGMKYDRWDVQQRGVVSVVGEGMHSLLEMNIQLI